jgi:hypothetical protein
MGLNAMTAKSKKRVPSDLADHQDEDASDAISAYLEYNKVLRTWFVAFGIGGPALFLVNEKIAGELAKLGSLRLVAACFLGGAVAQVVCAMINKFANWYVYMATIDTARKYSWQCKLADKVIEQFWFDILIDVGTLVAFGIAAWQMLTVFAKVAA